MRLVLMDEAGNIVAPNPSEIGNRAQLEMLEVFTECLLLHRKKRSTYGEAFRSQGYMGNLGRVLSKVARLKNMLWCDLGEQIESSEETTEDTLLDLINLSAFTIINKRDRNKWGNDR